MKIYCVGGRYLRTQDEAKARAKELGITFNPVTDVDDVPTDAKGLIAYLNDLVAGLVVGRPSESSAVPPSVLVDEAFEGLPVTHQLTLTALALENARAEIVRLKEHGELRVFPRTPAEDDAEDFI